MTLMHVAAKATSCDWFDVVVSQAARSTWTFGGLTRRRLRAVPLAVALDVGTKRWQTLILT